MSNIDTDEIAALSVDIAKEFLDRIKNTISEEIFKNLGPSQILAFAYANIFQEMCKDNLLHPATRAQLLKSVVGTMKPASDVVTYSYQTKNWTILGLAINKENATINSKNMVQDLWEKDVVPSYTIMIDASTTMLNTIQIQSPGERLKNAREENAARTTMGVHKSTP